MTAETPRSPFADLEALARTWIWPRGEARERLVAALHRATEDDLSILDEVVPRLGRIAAALALPLDFPTRLVEVRTDGVNALELEEIVPGDYVEVVGVRPTVGAVHTYPFSEGHSTLVFEAMGALRRVAADLRRVLAESPVGEDALATSLAGLLSDLPEDARTSLAARSPEADPEAGRRREWLADLTDWLERGAPKGEAPPTLPPPEAADERSDRTGTFLAPRWPSRLPPRPGDPGGPVLAEVKPDGTLFLDLDALRAYVKSLEHLTEDQDRELEVLQRRVHQQHQDLERLRAAARDAGPGDDQDTDDLPAKGDPR